MIVQTMRSQTTRPHQSSKQIRSGGSRFWRYAPLALWAVLIFVGSGDVLSGSHTSIILRAVRWLFPNVRNESLAVFHLLVRKAGHLTEYAIFATLAARAFRTSSHDLLRRHWFWVSLLLAIAYALSDEYHQSFVPSRTASIYDSLIDSVGALIALTIIWFRQRKSPQNRLRASAATRVS
jgi:VanZ family protein